MCIAYVTTTFRFDIDHVCENKISGRKALLSRNEWISFVLVSGSSCKTGKSSTGRARRGEAGRQQEYKRLAGTPLSPYISSHSK